jgi:hypothetical protein
MRTLFLILLALTAIFPQVHIEDIQVSETFILRGDLKQHLDKFTNLGIPCITEIPLPWLSNDDKLYDVLMEAEEAGKIFIISNFESKLILKPSKLFYGFFENKYTSLLFNEILKLAESNKEYEVATIAIHDNHFTISIMTLTVLPKQKRFFNFFEDDEASINLQFHKLLINIDILN